MLFWLCWCSATRWRWGTYNPDIPLSLFPLQAEQQRLLLGSRLGQDGRTVAEGERSRGQEEDPEDDAAAFTQPHDREHAHVARRRCHAPAGRNGPIGHRGGRCCTPSPPLLHPLYCLTWITFHPLFRSGIHAAVDMVSTFMPPHFLLSSHTRCFMSSPFASLLWLQSVFACHAEK